jgi:hypothetical protein
MNRKNVPYRFAVCSAVILSVLVCFAILTDAAGERLCLGIFQAGVFCLAIAWGIAKIIGKFQWAGHALMIPLGAAAAWGLVQILTNHTEYRFETWNAVLGWGTNFLLFCLSVQIFGFSEIRRTFRKSWVVFGLVLSVVAVLQWFTSEGKIFWIFPTQYDTALGPFVNRDHYAAFAALILPMALYEAFSDRRKTTAYTVIAGAIFASVIAGASRAGAILVTVEMIVLSLPFLLRSISEHRSLLAAGGRIFICAAVFTAVVGWEVVWDRFKEPDPYQFRREMLYSSLDMIRDRPLTGFGLDTWPIVYPAYALVDQGVFVNHAHNDWAEWASDGGIPFAAMLFLIFAWSVRYSFRFPWGAGVVAVMLHSLVDFPMQKPCLEALVFVLLGAMAASGRRHSS